MTAAMYALPLLLPEACVSVKSKPGSRKRSTWKPTVLETMKYYIDVQKVDLRSFVRASNCIELLGDYIYSELFNQISCMVRIKKDIRLQVQVMLHAWEWVALNGFITRLQHETSQSLCGTEQHMARCETCALTMHLTQEPGIWNLSRGLFLECLSVEARDLVLQVTFFNLSV